MRTNRRSETLIDRLLLHASQQPDRPVYHFLDGRGKVTQTITFAQLLTAVQQMAGWLSEKTDVGDRVVLQLPTSADFLITFFACLYSARIPVPLSAPNRKYSGDHYQKIFADCSAQVIITTPELKAIYKQNEQSSVAIAAQIEIFPTLAEIADERPAPTIKNHYNIAFLQYTSGSTSFPKGVKISPDNILANQRMIERAFGHSRDSVGLAWVPLFHDMGLIGSVIQPLYVGFPCYFMTPMTFVKRPKLWLDLIGEKRITTTGGPNFAFDMCLKRVDPKQLKDQSATALASWQVAYNGAEHIKLSTLEAFSDAFAPYGFRPSTFLPCYGLAEATLIVSGVKQSQAPSALTIPCSGDEIVDADAAAPAELTRTVVSSGEIMPELTLKIVDPRTLADCPAYHIGEVWIAGESISSGYWKQPDKTEKTFVTRGQQRFLRTGDLGFVSAQQSLYITGRLKDLIIIEGTNYAPEDIEETAQQAHIALYDSRIAAFAVTHQNALPQLVVVCEVNRPFSLEIDRYANDIRAAVQRAVYGRYQLQVRETVLLGNNTIPKTTSGKIQRQRTKLLYLVEQLPALSATSQRGESQRTDSRCNSSDVSPAFTAAS